jgi:hypothetical protein
VWDRASGSTHVDLRNEAVAGIVIPKFSPAAPRIAYTSHQHLKLWDMAIGDPLAITEINDSIPVNPDDFIHDLAALGVDLTEAFFWNDPETLSVVIHRKCWTLIIHQSVNVEANFNDTTVYIWESTVNYTGAPRWLLAPS